MKSLPADVVAYRRTPEFTADTVPAALLDQHATKAGVWGTIVVLEGRLRYHIDEPEVEAHVLIPGAPGVVEPGMLHRVEPLGAVRFYVEFFR